MSPTTSIANPVEDSVADRSPERRSIFARDGKAGLLARALAVTAALVVTAIGLTMARDAGWMLVELPRTIMIGIALVVWVSMILGVIFSEYPRGDQLALARVGLATFCRTGFPLLVILVAVNYATRLNSVAIYVGILYAVGLSLSLALEVSRLGLPLNKSTS